MAKIKLESANGPVYLRLLCEHFAHEIFEIDLTQDIERTTLEYAPKNHMFTVIVKQKAKGGHRFTWPENVKGDPVSLIPNSVTLQMFLFDGVTAWPVAPSWSSAPRPGEKAQPETAVLPKRRFGR
jgi:hypothetical protein